jgi:integrase/recombinase XerD
MGLFCKGIYLDREVRRVERTMDEVIQEFVIALASERRSSQNTLGAYRTDLRQLMSFLTERNISAWTAVTPADITDFAAYLRERQYANTSIARKVAALKSFFHYLQTRHLTEIDPSEDLQAPKVEKDLPHALSPSEVERLFAVVQSMSGVGQRDLAMLHTIYSTGMRVTELVSLNVGHVDLARGHVRCSGHNHKERILPLTLAAQSALGAYMDSYRQFLLRQTHEPALFLNHHGQRLTRQGFWLIIKGYARAAGIEHITPHTLRHSFALDMLGRGMELRSVQELLGHANISTTHVYKQMRRVQQLVTVP